MTSSVKQMKKDSPNAFSVLFYKIIQKFPRIHRMLEYRDPRKYWTERGGDTYFKDQEASENRAKRSQFIAERISELEFQSLLEVGCGYGKQLKAIYALKPVRLYGIDFSHPQLKKTAEFSSQAITGLAEADAEKIPFSDKCFDAVLSSAVILHNDYAKARKIISEMLRVSRKWVIHNEDTNISFSRYGYDLAATYAKMGLKLHTVTEIPSAPNPSITQFTVVELPAENYRVKAEDIPLITCK